MSFVTTVGEIQPGEASNYPELERAISYWNEDSLSSEEWLRQVAHHWGPAGLAMRRGEEMLGFVIFAPMEFLPRAETLVGALSDEDAVIMACVNGDRRVKKHLLVRMLKDLRHRGVTGVDAIASDFGVQQHVSTRFLLENGWRPVHRVKRPGRSYTLMRTDMGNTVVVGELARDIIGRVKLPRLKNPPAVPGESFVQVELTAHVASSLENGNTAVLTVEMPSGVVA
ncbi:hypothetical protein BH23ACT11_BH23ACT11_09270 [soil metagenome]